MSFCRQCGIKAVLVLVAYVITLWFGPLAIIPIGVTAIIYLIPLPSGVETHDKPQAKGLV